MDMMKHKLQYICTQHLNVKQLFISDCLKKSVIVKSPYSPEGLSGDEADTLSLRSALERHVSMETVATEPWLRPGTSDAVKRSASRPKPNCRTDALPWLTQHIT